MGEGVLSRSPLLDDPRYLHFLAGTHPQLQISDTRLAVPSFIASLDIREPLLPGFWRALLAIGAHLSPAHVTPKSLFLGTPFERYDQTSWVDAIADPERLAHEAYRVADDLALELVVITCVRPDAHNLARLSSAGFLALPSFPDTQIPLGAADFDHHLQTLPAADRSGIRRNRRRFEQAGHRVEPLACSRAEAAELFACYWPLYRRASVKWYPHTPEYFAGIAALDPQVSLTVARTAEDEIAGFILHFADGDTCHAGRIGIHPRFHRQDGVYFRLLYHVLEESLASRATRLVLEPTAYRFKRHLGARRKRLVNLVMGISPTWKLLLATLPGLGRRALSHLDNRRQLERWY